MGILLGRHSLPNKIPIKWSLYYNRRMSSIPSRITRSTAFRLGLMIFGVLCGSTAVILIKASHEHPFLVASYRLLIAALVLFPFFWRDLKTFSGKYGWRQLGWSAIPGVVLAVHFMSWVVGARMTVVASASLIANLTPVAMPFFVYFLYRERINRQEVIGTLFTMSGLGVLGWASLQVSQTNFTGDLICFGSMLAFAAYLALGRRNGQRLTLWLYMVPLYAIAGIVCLVSALPFINPLKPYETSELLLILGLGLVPTVFGHTILNYSLKFFRGQVVSVTNLGQPVFAGIMGFLIFGEVPQPVFFGAAALIVTGILIVLFSSYQRNANQKPVQDAVQSEEGEML
jgi:drug/metabolite transporter (DMT)-like permease